MDGIIDVGDDFDGKVPAGWGTAVAPRFDRVGMQRGLHSQHAIEKLSQVEMG